jgi:hypothetical protein
VPGQRSGDVTYRATAGAKPWQGNSRVCYEADRKIDARSQTQDSPRRTSGHAAQIRGSELDHRRLKASLPPLHDHNLDSFQHRSWGEDAEPRVRRLTRDIRAKYCHFESGGSARIHGTQAALTGVTAELIQRRRRRGEMVRGKLAALAKRWRGHRAGPIPRGPSPSSISCGPAPSCGRVISATHGPS